MPTVKLYKGTRRAQNIKNYNLATVDLAHATYGTDYTIEASHEGTLPTTGETIRQIKIHIPLEGINLVSGYVDDPLSDENLIPPNQIGVVNTEIIPAPEPPEGEDPDPPTIKDYYGIMNVETIPVGEKPADWDLHWYDQYMLRSLSPGNNQFYIYQQQGIRPDEWQSTYQYYKVQDLVNTFYTDATGSFSVSRVIYPTGGNNWDELVRVLYSTTRALNSSSHPGYWWWRVGGISGTNLFFVDNMDWVQQNSIAMTRHYSFSSYDELLNYESYMICQMVRFKLANIEYTGIMVLKFGADYEPLEADIVALSSPFWVEEYTPSTGGPTSHAKGGYGTHTAPSDNYGDRYGNTVAGMVSRWNTALDALSRNQNRYRLNLSSGTESGALTQLIDRLWNPRWVEAFTNLFYNPKDAIIVSHFLPGKLGARSINTTERIVGGGFKLTQNAVHKFSETIREHHVGDINIEEMRGAFPDFDDTEIYIHLPYVGTYQLDIAGVMNGWLAVDYATDVLSGDITAFVTVQDTFGNRQLRYEYRGNCARKMDLYARDKTPYQAAMGTAISAAVKIGAAAATAGISGLTAVGLGTRAMAGGLGRAISGFTKMKIANGVLQATSAQVMSSIANFHASSSGQATAGSTASATGTVSATTDTRCWVLITRPEWSNPEGYGELFGFPSDIGGVINGTFTGFLKVRTAFLDGIPCTADEKSEIANYLVNGVYLNPLVITPPEEET